MVWAAARAGRAEAAAGAALQVDLEDPVGEEVASAGAEAVALGEAAATAEAVAARALEVAVALVQVDSVVSAAPGEAWAVGSKAVAAE